MKNLLIALVIIVLALLGIVYYKTQYQDQLESIVDVNAPDDTASINSDLAEVDLGDLDAEFKSIDSDLNSL